ncbi:MAG: hypothetical protein V3T70_04100 [Phycisphaerae bacterium]
MRCLVSTAALLLLVFAGCHGTARLEAIPLHPGAIDPPPPSTYRFDAQRCYWWTDANGDLVIVMQFDRYQLFAAIKQAKLNMSFVLNGMPEGQGRNYAVTAGSFRAVYAAGLLEDRFYATHGICGVLMKDDGRLTGSYRLWVQHHPGPGLFNLFPRQPSPLLFQGTFEAVRDDDGLGQAILEATEAHGWGRAAQK